MQLCRVFADPVTYRDITNCHGECSIRVAGCSTTIFCNKFILVYITTHSTPTRPETGHQYTTQHTVHLQGPRQAAGAQHNTHLYNTAHLQGLRQAAGVQHNTQYTYKALDRPLCTTQHTVHLQSPRQATSVQQHAQYTYKARDRSPIHLKH